MIEQSIDVRDIDTEWFLGVRVFVDRAGSRFLFPLESIQRLGDQDAEAHFYTLLNGQVIAEPEHLQVDGVEIAVWAVSCHLLTTRPASSQQ